MLEEMSLEIQRLKETHQLRSLKILKGRDFCSNDYLGLSRNSDLSEALISFIQKGLQLWSGSSRLIHGTTEVHKNTEEFLSTFLKREASLIFNSGFTANTGVIEALCAGATVFSDELNHASIIDGLRNAKSKKIIYRHNDLNHLEDMMKKNSSSKKLFLVTESVFSMEGTRIDLPNVVSLCNRFGVFLILDEAHATGIFGPQGQGLLSTVDFDKERSLSVHTCGKALGVSGAFVGCSDLVKTFLVNKCRHFIYTTALPPLQIFQIQEALRYICKNPSLIQNLWENIKYTNQKLPQSLQSDSQIFSIPLRGNRDVCELEKYFKKMNIAAKAIRYPTVSKGKERIRLSIHSNHKRKDIDDFFLAFEEFLKPQQKVHFL